MVSKTINGYDSRFLDAEPVMYTLASNPLRQIEAINEDQPRSRIECERKQIAPLEQTRDKEYGLDDNRGP